MKPTFTRRHRRRSIPTKTEGAFFKKESQETFFGGAEHETFFQPAMATAPAIQRKDDNCEVDKKVQRMEEKKEEEKVMKKEDKKEEETVQRQPEKKEEEKVMKKEDKKEEEKVQRQPEKKEEEKIQRAADNKEEEKVMKKEEKKEEEKVMKTEDKKEEEKVQKKEAGNTSAPGNSVSNYISSLNGKGNPLPAQSNHFFSSKMGYDFSEVKVHNDKEAAESAKAINAKAYTIGNNVVFNEGQYNTESGEGKKLMAHELAHVVQQGKSSGKIQRVRGMRPPARRPVAPPRGPYGQLPGQRLPPRRRNLPTETFERREQRRAEEAHQQFLQAIKRNQQWLERWGREGSEPKTAAQKAFMVFVKVLEIWDEFRNTWDETHKRYEQTLRDRASNPEIEYSDDFDRRLIETGMRLKEFDKEMFTRLHAWQMRLDKWIEWYNRVFITPSNALYLFYELVVLVWDGITMGHELSEKIRRINFRIPLSFSHLINPYQGQMLRNP